MASYILKRLLLMIPTLFGVLLLTFVVIQFVPGGPVEQMVAQLQGNNGGGERAGGGGGQGGAGGYRGRQGIDLLAGMGDADQQRAHCGEIPLEGQGAVVETAAHAEAVPGGIETGQRQQDCVHRASRVARSARLGNAEAVALQARAAAPAHERQREGRKAAQDRKKELMMREGAQGADGACIDLAVGRPVQGDASACAQLGQGGEAPRQRPGGLFPGGRGKGSPPVAQGPAQLRTSVGVGRSHERVCSPKCRCRS